MPKKDTTATPTPPSDQPTEQPGEHKALTIELAPTSAALLRRVSKKTGITQARLRAVLAGSAAVEKAIETALRQAYDDWRRSLGDDLFGEKGEADA